MKGHQGRWAADGESFEKELDEAQLSCAQHEQIVMPVMGRHEWWNTSEALRFAFSAPLAGQGMIRAVPRNSFLGAGEVGAGERCFVRISYTSNFAR